MSSNLDKAKEIFFYYACNHFFLDRDMDREEYEALGASSAQEAAWRREYISHWINQLSTDDLRPVDRLRDTWAGEAIPQLIDMADKGDGFAKLRYANALWDLGNGAATTSSTREDAIQTAVRLWRSLLHRVPDISEPHKRTIAPHMSALNASTPEEYVKEYARRKLLEAKAKENA